LPVDSYLGPNGSSFYMPALKGCKYNNASEEVAHSQVTIAFLILINRFINNENWFSYNGPKLSAKVTEAAKREMNIYTLLISRLIAGT
jgi:hypothetical protein